MSLSILNPAKLHVIAVEYQRAPDEVSEAGAQIMGIFPRSWILDKHPMSNPMRAHRRCHAVLKQSNGQTAWHHGLLLEMRANGELPVRGNAAVVRSVDARHS